ncbi:MAG: TadE/TadG family type IV pilus assembly protein [Rhodospirillales bacterium]
MRIFPLIGACRTFRRDERGSPVVEFAIGGPVFFLMVCAIVEFGLVMFVIVLWRAACATHRATVSPASFPTAPRR